MKNKVKEILNFPRIIEFEVPEHCHYIAFNNDDDAVLFEYWWNKEGYKQYLKYREENKDEIH